MKAEIVWDILDCISRRDFQHLEGVLEYHSLEYIKTNKLKQAYELKMMLEFIQKSNKDLEDEVTCE